MLVAFLAATSIAPVADTRAQGVSVRENLVAALDQSLPELCFDPLVVVKRSAAVPPQSAGWPIEMRPGAASPASDALLQAGLVDKVAPPTLGSPERRSRFGEGRPSAGEALALSPGAAPYLRTRILEGPVQVGEPVVDRRVCFARQAVERVLHSTIPVNTLAGLAVRVTYTARLIEIAPWALLPEVQSAISEVRAAFGAQDVPRSILLIQTDQGWRPLDGHFARQQLAAGATGLAALASR